MVTGMAGAVLTMIGETNIKEANRLPNPELTLNGGACDVVIEYSAMLCNIFDLMLANYLKVNRF